MTTAAAAPHRATPPHAPPATPLAPPLTVRRARKEDAAALAELSLPFVRSGALRERPVSLFSAHAAEFLVAQAPGGPLEGCVGLRVHPAGPEADGRSAGVLYNFCVAGRQQGRGVGVGLLHAALALARARSLDALFTATTGGGALFLRNGFTPTTARLAPPAWAASLDPRRGARILTRAP
ncbi:GNAT family N-acetyltransferase [Streptomyces sp. NPDC050504]|uniref:GNAT family N-acetyltransferase n=1 Tax=Streptomyces sp. NPDC050504 TaxID=3365618 RepID=UPI0037BDFD5C